MKKTLLTILACGFMVLGLTGCGNNSDSISTENKEKVVNEIESYIVQDRKSLDDNYKNSYEVTVTNIEIEGLNATFSGKIKIKYSDGSENKEVSFEGKSSIKSGSYSIYNTDVDYHY